MSNQRIKIPRCPDRSVIDAFKEICTKYKVSSVNINALGFTSLGDVNLTAPDENANWKALLEHDSTLIDSMSMRFGGFTIAYYRGGQYQPDQKSPFIDEISLNWDQNQNQKGPSDIDRLNIVASLSKQLKAFDPSRHLGQGISGEHNQLLAIHESTLERLERLNEDLVRQSSEFRKNLEDQFSAKLIKNEEMLSKQRDKLETDHRKEMESLDNKEKVLEEKLAAVDDRDNTHARREIRDRMLEDVKNRINKFGVSENTEKKRRPVLMGILSLIGILIGLMTFTAYEITVSQAVSDRTTFYLLSARFVLITFALLGTILYYIKWQNRWAEQHANSEFQLQQFYLDINRSNWVIESCLEWRKETDSAIPKELLESITNNLFVNDQREIEKVVHPADELASALLGSASKLNIKLGENVMEFDKPGKITKKAIPLSPGNDKKG
jgi:hypothetical protein